MEIYFAPIEGVTNYRYRSIHQKYYKGVDKYFIPFLKASNGELRTQDKKEIDKLNNNMDCKVIPQILSKNALETLQLIETLKQEGYDEINLNFGCPSATVVPKGKGGGILKDLDLLDQYLEKVFQNVNIKISIKLRIGINQEEEFDNILKVLNKYPIYELIIHPRTVKDYYTGPIHFNILKDLDQKTNFDIIYNGDIESLEDIDFIMKSYPYLKGVMIGRGFLKTPDLLEVNQFKTKEERKEKVKKFYFELIQLNRKIFGKENSLFYEKQIWAYFSSYFLIPKNLIKKISKARKEIEMDEVIQEIFDTCELNQNYTLLEKKYNK